MGKTLKFEPRRPNPPIDPETQAMAEEIAKGIRAMFTDAEAEEIRKFYEEDDET
jgi:hypothetical protein